jgi:hypothetical protein
MIFSNPNTIKQFNKILIECSKNINLLKKFHQIICIRLHIQNIDQATIQKLMKKIKVITIHLTLYQIIN